LEKLSLTGKAGHGAGDETLRGLSAVLIDGDDVFIDNGAIHAKSRVEREIRFLKSLDEVPNPRLVWGFWVTLKRREGGVQGFHGIMPFQLHIDQDAKLGYKNLAQHVNHMEKAVKGHADLTGVPDAVRDKLQRFLQSVRPDLWENAAETFLQAFEGKRGE
jgi:hypothetical protein